MKEPKLHKCHVCGAKKPRRDEKGNVLLEKNKRFNRYRCKGGCK